MKYLKITKSITDFSNSIINKYFKDINKEPLLTKEEEFELAAKAREGDEVARDKLIKSNLRFVISIAKRYQNQGIPLEDLIAEGNVGLIEAVSRYDERKGYRFISYAVWWIRQAITKSIYDKSRTIRLPITQIYKISKVNKAIEEFERNEGRPPSDDEIFKLTGLENANQILDSAKNCISLDSPFDLDDETGTLLDVIPDKVPDDYDYTGDCENVFKSLGDREADILRLSFGIGVKPMKFDEIGRKFGLTGERIRQIRENCLQELRNRLL